MKNSVFCVFFALFGCFCLVSGYQSEVENVYYWREVLYENQPYSDYTLIGKYPYRIPGNNDITGIEYHAKSGLMVTTVGRIRPGIPSTLNAFCVADYDKGTSPYIWGFPDYEKNTLKPEFYRDSFYDSRNLLNKNHNYSAG
uniref:Uncharacterized protein n=1 Tax=Phlebotomus papatasi TaxID=29031 RepID=A0A1B0DIC2_PHLPP